MDLFGSAGSGYPAAAAAPHAGYSAANNMMGMPGYGANMYAAAQPARPGFGGMPANPMMHNPYGGMPAAGGFYGHGAAAPAAAAPMFGHAGAAAPYGSPYSANAFAPLTSYPTSSMGGMGMPHTGHSAHSMQPATHTTAAPAARDPFDFGLGMGSNSSNASGRPAAAPAAQPRPTNTAANTFLF